MLTDLQRPLDAVLYLQTDRESLLDRLGHRHRQDDRADIADHRIDVFLEQTAPLIGYYRDHGKLRLIDGARPPEMVAAAMDEVIRPLVSAGGASSSRPTPS
jgi:adenylate kinase